MAIALHDTDGQREDWRLPGCRITCRKISVLERGSWDIRDVTVHDPCAHEEYGHLLDKAITLSRGDLTYVVGALRLTRFDCRAFVRDVEVHFTPREWYVLWYLASKRGEVCSHAEVIANVWGPEYLNPIGRQGFNGKHPESQLLRVNIDRVRKKLGRDRNLIETRPGHGYRLAVPT